MFDDVTYDDRAAYLEGEDTLVIADLHIGRVATSDVELPMGEAADLSERLAGLLDTHDPTDVVVAGDLLHAFGSVPYGVPEMVDRIVDTVAAADATLSVVEGNHDTVLEDITDLSMVPASELGDGTVIHHGHEVPEIDGDGYIIGHEHPAIAIEGDRHPCFLECRNQHDDASVLVLPAFNRFAIGTLVNSMEASDSMSPLLTQMDACRPVVRTEDQTLTFPGLRTLSSYL